MKRTLRSTWKAYVASQGNFDNFTTIKNKIHKILGQDVTNMDRWMTFFLQSKSLDCAMWITSLFQIFFNFFLIWINTDNWIWEIQRSKFVAILEACSAGPTTCIMLIHSCSREHEEAHALGAIYIYNVTDITMASHPLSLLHFHCSPIDWAWSIEILCVLGYSITQLPSNWEVDLLVLDGWFKCEL